MTASPAGRVVDLEDDTTVVTIEWPDHDDRRATIVATGRAALLVVERGQPPPTDLEPLEDWIRAPIDPIERAARVKGLRLRQQRLRGGVHLDDDRSLRVADRRVTLTEHQQALLIPLLARIGQPTPRAVVERASAQAGGPADPDHLRRALSRLRGRLAEVGLDLHLLSGRAVLLERPDSDSSHRADRTRNLQETSTQDSDARPTRLN